jgi:hypothetical protein
MGWLFFLMILLVTAIVVVLARAVGVRIRFESVFKVIAIAVSMLGVLLLSAMVVFICEFGVLMVVGLTLSAAGLLPSIPHHYEVLAIWLMAAVAVCIPGIGWVRYVLLAGKEP